MKTLAERIFYIRNELGLTQEAFGARVGTTKQTVSQWEDGTIKSLKSQTILKLEEKTGFSAQWIATGRDPRQAGAANTQPAPGVSSVPLISWVQAGQWNEVADHYHVGEGEKPVYTTKKIGPRAYALRVVGDSMENPSGRPTYPQGALIIVDPDREPTHDKPVIVRLEDSQEATFKMLKVDGDRRYLRPLNPRYPDIAVTKNAVFCGVVVQTVIDED